MRDFRTIIAFSVLTALAACGSDSEKFEGVWANGKGGFMLVNKGATEVTQCVEGLGIAGSVRSVKAEGDALKDTTGDAADIQYALKDDKPVLNGGKADFFKSDMATWDKYCK